VIRLLSPADYVRVPWKNGGGVSTTIAGERLPGAASGDWSGAIWQLGRTAIVAPGPFSDLSGFERLQTVVRGEGLFLDTSSGAIDVSRPLTVVRYDGGVPIVSRLTRGPVEVVNLIARRDRKRIGLRALRAGEHAALEAGAHVLYACAGPAMARCAGEKLPIADDHAALLGDASDIACDEGVILLASVSAP
jgi:uncharacterized protein